MSPGVQTIQKIPNMLDASLESTVYFIKRIKTTCKQVTVSPGKQKVKAGCALSHTGQCYGSGQGFPGNVFVVWHTFIHGGFKIPGVLQPTAPAQLPRVQESPAACFEDAHTVMTDNDREDGYKMAIL